MEDNVDRYCTGAYCNQRENCKRFLAGKGKVLGRWYKGMVGVANYTGICEEKIEIIKKVEK